MRYFLFTATLEFNGNPFQQNYGMSLGGFPSYKDQEKFVRRKELGVIRVFCTPPVEVSFEDFKTYMGL